MNELLQDDLAEVAGIRRSVMQTLAGCALEVASLRREVRSKIPGDPEFCPAITDPLACIQAAQLAEVLSAAMEAVLVLDGKLPESTSRIT